MVSVTYVRAKRRMREFSPKTSTDRVVTLGRTDVVPSFSFDYNPTLPVRNVPSRVFTAALSVPKTPPKSLVVPPL